ncbi:MAG TPA: serine/threonine-protein kinase, partial [Polyangiaceae bacterium]|nr:serine/threonine-protein kinase [Polyangiaceae bacterium]
VFYYAMEYADGLSLEELVRNDGPQPAARVVHILHQAAGALSEAHRLGLIHRDVKPANILLCERGGVPDTVKVVDFGLVKEIATESDVQVTQANTITGTPSYLAPEMITTPNDVDGRADLYALGAVGYFMLTGEPVFDGATVVEVCGHHLHSKPEPPSQRRGEPIDEDLERLVLTCLAKRKEDRSSSARALEGELARLAKKHPWSTDEAQGWWLRWRREHPAQASTSMTNGSFNISTRRTKKRTASAPSITR